MRLRLILAFILVVLVSVASVVIVVRQSAAQEVGRFMVGGGMGELSDLEAVLERYYQEHGSWQGVESVLGMRGTPGHGPGAGGQGMGGMMNARLRLADATGALVYDSRAAAPAGSLTPAELGNAVRLQTGLHTVGYLLAENGLGFNRTDQDRLVRRLGNGALVAGLVGGGLSLVLGLLLAYTLTRPVQALTAAAGRLARGDLAQRVPVRGQDEIARLARSFNEMAASLEAAERSRRDMTADIAHELRTPLAVQRAHLEALQDGVYPLALENLEPVLAQNLLLTRLVNDLRTLALAEAGQLPLERAATALPDLAAGVARRFEPQAAARQVTLRFSPPPDAAAIPPLPLDAQRVEQILTNLLSNALRYTPAGGEIELAVRLAAAGSPAGKSDDPGAVMLTVRDGGAGIPPAAVERIFERFYRADRARSRVEGGAGLGLAIARQLAEAHGGRLTAANHPQGGALFTLTLPLPPVPPSP